MPLPVCSQVQPVLNKIPILSWVYTWQSQWYYFISKYRPLAAQAYLTGFELRFDAQCWWIDDTAYELLYCAKGPWWVFKFKNQKTGRKESIRILFSQLSCRDQWQLNLLFQHYP